jgi:hypothetical protein
LLCGESNNLGEIGAVEEDHDDQGEIDIDFTAGAYIGKEKV